MLHPSLLAFLAAATLLPAAGSTLYISPLTQSTVLTLNAPGFNSLAGFIAGYDGTHMVLSPDGRSVYITSGDTGVVKFDLATGQPVARFVTGVPPSFVALSPDGTVLYALTYQELISFNTTSGSQITSTVLPSSLYALAMAVSPDGSKIYVGSLYEANPSTIIDFNAKTLAVNGYISDAGTARSLAFSPTSGLLYATDSYDVVAVNTSTDSVVATISLGAFVDGVAVSSDGSQVYAATNAGLIQISTATNQVVNVFDSSQSFSTVTLTPDGTVASCITGTGYGPNPPLLVSITVATGALSQRTINGNPATLIYSSDGTKAYALLSSTFDLDYASESANQINAVIPGVQGLPLLASSPKGDKIAARSSSSFYDLNSEMGTGVLSIIDTSSHNVEATYSYQPTQSNAGLALNSSATVAIFPATTYNTNVEILNLTTGDSQLVFFDGQSNVDVVISPDDSTAYVSVPQLCAINIAAASINFCGASLTDSQVLMRVMAMDSSGTHVFALSGRNVGQYDTSSLQVSKSVNLPDGIVPAGIAYSAANNSIYVIAVDQNTSPFTGLVIRMDAASLMVQATRTLEDTFSNLALSADGTQLYLAEYAQQIGILNGLTLAPIETIKHVEAYSLAVAN